MSVPWRLSDLNRRDAGEMRDGNFSGWSLHVCSYRLTNAIKFGMETHVGEGRVLGVKSFSHATVHVQGVGPSDPNFYKPPYKYWCPCWDLERWNLVWDVHTCVGVRRVSRGQPSVRCPRYADGLINSTAQCFLPRRVSGRLSVAYCTGSAKNIDFFSWPIVATSV